MRKGRPADMHANGTGNGWKDAGLGNPEFAEGSVDADGNGFPRSKARRMGEVFFLFFRFFLSLVLICLFLFCGDAGGRSPSEGRGRGGGSQDAEGGGLEVGVGETPEYAGGHVLTRINGFPTKAGRPRMGGEVAAGAGGGLTHCYTGPSDWAPFSIAFLRSPS